MYKKTHNSTDIIFHNYEDKSKAHEQYLSFLYKKKHLFLAMFSL